MQDKQPTLVGVDSHVQITGTTVYEHPDGGRLWVTSTGKIGITEPWDGNDTEDCAALNIGIEGLKLLAFRLLALATELEAGGAR